MQSKAAQLIGFLCAFLAVPVVAASAPVLYPTRALFEAALGSSVTDPYSAAGYFAGDVFDLPFGDRHSDAHMSAVLGETDYTTTGFADNNLIVFQTSGSAAYCAGCNGSFRLTFTSTSVGTSVGVFGVGFDFGNSSALTPYHAFFSFGDGSTQDYLLPIIGTPGNNPPGFF